MLAAVPRPLLERGCGAGSLPGGGRIPKEGRDGDGGSWQHSALEKAVEMQRDFLLGSGL